MEPAAARARVEPHSCRGGPIIGYESTALLECYSCCTTRSCPRDPPTGGPPTPVPATRLLPRGPARAPAAAPDGGFPHAAGPPGLPSACWWCWSCWPWRSWTRMTPTAPPRHYLLPVSSPLSLLSPSLPLLRPICSHTSTGPRGAAGLQDLLKSAEHPAPHGPLLLAFLLPPQRAHQPAGQWPHGARVCCARLHAARSVVSHHGLAPGLPHRGDRPCHRAGYRVCALSSTVLSSPDPTTSTDPRREVCCGACSSAAVLSGGAPAARLCAGPVQLHIRDLPGASRP